MKEIKKQNDFKETEAYASLKTQTRRRFSAAGKYLNKADQFVIVCSVSLSKI